MTANGGHAINRHRACSQWSVYILTCPKYPHLKDSWSMQVHKLPNYRDLLICWEASLAVKSNRGLLVKVSWGPMWKEYEISANPKRFTFSATYWCVGFTVIKSQKRLILQASEKSASCLVCAHPGTAKASSDKSWGWLLPPAAKETCVQHLIWGSELMIIQEVVGLEGELCFSRRLSQCILPSFWREIIAAKSDARCILILVKSYSSKTCSCSSNLEASDKEKKICDLKNV